METWPERNRFQIGAETEELLRFIAKSFVRYVGYNETSKYLIALLSVFISGIK
jgi:hypothetical protein